ncbi:hypothetical protein DMUE_0088 [Dictyocoela muelleri]|nr:hypothetical protein DMUE_0091 [Dictyocoela muelleri]KAG0442688.1 hypothetical protein DMUE_0088 [Dictyocoela muelleri]
MNFQIEPKNTRSPIFLTNKAAIGFIKFIGLIDGYMNCPRCSTNMYIEHDPSYSIEHRARCSNNSCKKSRPLFEGLKIGQFQIDLFEYLFIIYNWLEKKF